MTPKTPGKLQAMGTGGSSPTVLVVEDEAALRSGIRRLLEDAGYTVMEAENGATALGLLEDTASERIDLVLTDLRMPVNWRPRSPASTRAYPSCSCRDLRPS
jgi:CheY-like chemotaxis protein